MPNGEVNTGYSSLQHSIYHQYMDQWLMYFPRKQIHIVDGDELIKNPLSELEKVETFLGLSHKIRAQNILIYDEQKGFYCMREEPLSTECLSEKKGMTHPQVSSALLDQLRAYFQPHNELFYEQVGQRFNWGES